MHQQLLSGSHALAAQAFLSSSSDLRCCACMQQCCKALCRWCELCLTMSGTAVACSLSTRGMSVDRMIAMETCAIAKPAPSFGHMLAHRLGWLCAGKLSKATDVYAFGVTLWEMLTGQRPWAGLLQMQVDSPCLFTLVQFFCPAGSQQTVWLAVLLVMSW